MSKPTCSIDGCAKPAEARTWCHTHYTRWYRHGDPNTKLKRGGICTVEGCDRKIDARGMCSTHYGRWLKWGTPHKHVTPVEDRFWSNVDVGHPLGCWLWTLAPSKAGYGIFGHQGRKEYAHRFAYTLLIGPIDDGLHIDHLCRNTMCVNPDHLEAVTPRTNILRGSAPVIRRYRRRHGVRTFA